tara:strand:+ start:140 stop:490 length:351 start_codon:yes stop_codon:yes gene_type:complete
MKVGAFIIDSSGNISGLEDTSKLDNAKWYQKLFAKLSKRYRQSLTILAPIPWDNPPKEFIPNLNISPEYQKLEVSVPLTDKKGRKNGITENNKVDDEFIKKMLNESDDKRWTIKPL